MKLMTKALEKTLPALNATENDPDPLVRIKFFHPMHNWTWYAIEGEGSEEFGWLFYGLVVGFEIERGHFALSELESVKIGGLEMERDLYFSPKPLSEVRELHKNLMRA